MNLREQINCWIKNVDLREQVNSWEEILLEIHNEIIPNIIGYIFNPMLIITVFLGTIAYYIKDFVFSLVFFGFLLMYVGIFVQFGLGARNTEYIITDKKIYAKIGLYPILLIAPIENIKDVKIERGLLQKFYNTGTIVVTYTKPEDPRATCYTIPFSNIKDYENVFQIISEMREDG